MNLTLDKEMEGVYPVFTPVIHGVFRSVFNGLQEGCRGNDAARAYPEFARIDIDVLLKKSLLRCLRMAEAMDQQTHWSVDLDSPEKSAAIGSDPQWENLHLCDDPRWQLAQRIAASSSFSRSALLSRFLLYVCERALNGKTDEISEHQIGVHVFGRRPEYNPSEDNIVRSYARQLRQRLDQYFDAEGKHEDLRLSIPRGKYVPHFESSISPDTLTSRDYGVQEVRNLVTEVSPARQIVPVRPKGIYVLVIALFAVILLAGFVLTSKMTTRAASAQVDTSHPLWAQIFEKSRQTLLVPADDGIVMIQNLTNHSIHLAEYIDRDYVSIKSPYKIDAQNMADLDQQRYTSMADLDTVLKFSRLPEAAPDRFVVRYARELHMEDLKDTNAILIGSSFSNPWVELFQKNLNFEFEYQPRPNQSVILNRHPLQGELPVYENDAVAPSHRTYAVIALVPNLNDTGWVLIIEGLTMAGTQAATDILFNREAMLPVLDKARTASGQLNPFELLIETRSFGSSSPQASIIAVRDDSKPAS